MLPLEKTNHVKWSGKREKVSNVLFDECECIFMAEK
jgi:hypothetical protein